MKWHNRTARGFSPGSSVLRRRALKGHQLDSRPFPAFSALSALSAFKVLDAGFSRARVLVLAAKTLLDAG